MKLLDELTKIIDFIIKARGFLLLFIPLVASAGGNIFQWFEVEDKTVQLKQTQTQVAQVAEAYQAVYKPEVVYKDCNCDAAIVTHVKKYH